MEVTPDKKTVWKYDAGRMNGNESRPVEVHAFQRLANGRTMIVESGPARIIEVDKAGRPRLQAFGNSVFRYLVSRRNSTHFLSSQ